MAPGHRLSDGCVHVHVCTYAYGTVWFLRTDMQPQTHPVTPADCPVTNAKMRKKTRVFFRAVGMQVGKATIARGYTCRLGEHHPAYYTWSGRGAGFGEALAHSHCKKRPKKKQKCEKKPAFFFGLWACK